MPIGQPLVSSDMTQVGVNEHRLLNSANGVPTGGQAKETPAETRRSWGEGYRSLASGEAARRKVG
jgi:hypothetical protein